VFKSKLMRSAVVAVMATFAIGSSVPSAPAASKTIELLISADTNIQTLWNTVLIPAFEKEYPGYKVNVTLTVTDFAMLRHLPRSLLQKRLVAIQVLT